MRVWFTSDTHYGHTNVIKYCNRPFASTAEMNEAMISRWNEVVDYKDTVYHIGDFAFLRDVDEVLDIIGRLKGNKVLIMGNHDKKMHSHVKKQFMFVRDFYELRVPDVEKERGYQEIVLLHYAMRVWNKSHYGAWHLYGHSHGSLPDDPRSLSMDVGVDCHNYYPISYEYVKERMAKKKFKPIDHHGRGEM